MRPTPSRAKSRSAAAAALAALAALTLPATVVGPAEAGPPTPREASSAAGGSLKVKVVKPARGKVARITLRGPDGYRRVLRRTTRLTGLEPGRYRIKAATVRTTSWYSKPEISRRTVRVRARRSATTRVSYWTVVSTRTKVLTDRQIRDYRAPDPNVATSTGTMVLRTRMPVGAILAAGVTRQTPYGALVTVTKAAKSSAGWSHTVTQATIGDAVPRGELDEKFTVSTLTPGATARSAPTYRAACSGSINLDTELTGDASFTPHFQARWAWHKSSVTLGVSALAWVNAVATAQARGECHTGEITLYGQNLSVIAFAIGPIPVVLVPRIDVTAGASVRAEGKVKVEGGLSAKGDASVTVRLGTPTFSGSGPTFAGGGKVTTYANADADAHAKARLSMLLYGVGGPYAEAQAGLTAQADTTATPWWIIDGYAQAGAGVHVGGCIKVLWKKFCVNLGAGRPDLVKGTVRLTAATTPYQPQYTVLNRLEGPHLSIGSLTSTGPAGSQGLTQGFSPAGVSDYHLTTGLVSEVPGPVDSLASTDHQATGYDPLSTGPNDPNFDASTLELSVVPEFDRLRIPYVFGTEETPAEPRDVMGVFVDGVNCAVDAQGRALTSTAAIRSNAGQVLPTRYDRVTDPRACVLPVVPGRPVRVVVAVADTLGTASDSAVAIVGEGISSFRS